MDQRGAVVERYDPHAAHGSVFQRAPGQARFDLGDLVLDGRDHRKRVLHKARDDHASDRRGAFVVECASAEGRALGDPPNVANADRSVVARRHDRGLEVLQVLYEAKATDHILDVVDLKGPRTDIEVRVADSVRHLAQGHAMGTHRFGVDVDLILADEAADGRYFADSGHGLERVAHGPVLNAAQLIRVPPPHDLTLRVLALQRIPEDLPQRGCVGPQRGGHPVRHGPRCERRQLLEHSRARPVELHVILEDHVDGRKPEGGRAANRAHARNAQQCRGERIRDLVLDVPGRPTRPGGEHDLLVLTDVGNRIDGYGVSRQGTAVPRERRHIDAARNQHQTQQEHDQTVVDEPSDRELPGAQRPASPIALVLVHQCLCPPAGTACGARGASSPWDSGGRKNAPGASS